MTISNGKQIFRVGLISDTHGLFRPEIADIFAGVDSIFHAGDIGKPAVLLNLQKIAPVTAVLGNVDLPTWYPGVEDAATVEFGGYRFLILHNVDELDLDPKTAEIDAVIFGHTHKPCNRERSGVWYINPGSAGVPRFLTPVNVAVLTINNGLSVEFHQLKG